MDSINEEKSSFITDKGTYCYKVMSFGLNNAGATYQRLVTKMFHYYLGKTMDVYIDDMLVKSQHVGAHIQYLFDTFQILRKFNMKLNPEKCAFGVSSDFSQGIQLDAEKELQVFNGSNPGTWTLFTDGSSNVKGAGLGIVLVPPTGETIRQGVKCHPITNNEAEYEAVIAGLELSRELGIEKVYGILLEDKKKAQELCQKAARYCLNQGNLYRKMFGGPLARCLGPSQTEYVMKEIQKRHCRNHAGGISLVKTIIRAGYYWPKMKEEAKNFVAKCDKCQRYGNNMHRPAELLHPVVAPWPFMKLGMDIIGPLPQAKGAQITEFFQSWQIKRITLISYHLVGNGQVESTNKFIIKNLKKRLEESKGNWPGVLWAYRITTKISTGEIPFSLVYGVEALIPVDIGEPSTRIIQANEELNEREMQDYVLKKVFQSTRAINAGKLSPNWEGPYKIRGIARKGAYELETLAARSYLRIGMLFI
uniref:Uncharacterized protein n=1 Tax=Nicotiana tabacum TaxID=4097 RepID=A0A1S3ZTH8_TOBAC|nr:PREDICTED: uncharacterized protein LOC107790280 [Nicotiana tabacum]